MQGTYGIRYSSINYPLPVSVRLDIVNELGSENITQSKLLYI